MTAMMGFPSRSDEAGIYRVSHIYATRDAAQITPHA